ncbi:MAG: DUF4974 domain-containing protein [Bacteroidales bacterium]|jgi:ferric-dicitrate binding protein FerR (iron transport regulator)|nr:DUF4974 domain-containing protein [Bacteroidales bacterium]
MGINNQDEILSLIAKHLTATADQVETARLKEWIEYSEENRRYFEQVGNIWDLSDRSIDLSKINTDEALKEVQKRTIKKSPVRTLWRSWQKIAAIIIIPLLAGTNLWIYQKSKRTISQDEEAVIYTEVIAAFGTRTSLSLADSTLVWLNSGSSLRYPNKFSDTDFKVYLTGEAYFEVRKKNPKPFIVQTSTLQVKATGTRFNVQEYSSDNISEVALVSGKIFVNELDDDNNQSNLIAELFPNQRLTYNRQTKIKQITDEDTYRFVAWKDGKLIFRNDPLEEVSKKLSMMFNVDIEVKGSELKNYRYRATFEDESLEEILKLLKLSSPINFSEENRVALPDGSYPKKKVIIYPAI